MHWCLFLIILNVQKAKVSACMFWSQHQSSFFFGIWDPILDQQLECLVRNFGRQLKFTITNFFFFGSWDPFWPTGGKKSGRDGSSSGLSGGLVISGRSLRFMGMYENSAIWRPIYSHFWRAPLRQITVKPFPFRKLYKISNIRQLRLYNGM